MKKLLLGLLVTLPIAFATQASALPGVGPTGILNPAFSSDVIEIKGGHGRGRGRGLHGRGRYPACRIAATGRPRCLC